MITCKSCSKQYVGETKDPLNIRINGHRSSIYTNDQESPIGPHFNLPGHSWHDMSVIAIETNSTWSDRERQDKEKFWQHQLKTFMPHGLNKSADFFNLT